MKKNYSRFNINLFFVLLNSKNSLLIVLIVFLFSLDNFAQSISNFNPINACANSGASVIITGTNFTGATSVTFNGISATSFTVDNDSQISAILSTTATTGFILVITPLGTASSTGIFTVDLLPTATAGGTQTICSSATATVSGASATNGTILWTENGAGTITAGATTLTPTYTPTAADAGTSVTLTMTVTSNNACAPQTQTATYTIIVNPLPTAIAGGTQTICSNATATVSGASATNGTIVWTENGAGTITAGATTLTPTYTPTAADAGTAVTLTMTVTSNNACAPQTQTATYTVIVNPLPTATAGGTQTICSNATATVSGASATNGTILWTENGAGTITAGATTLTPTYTPTAADAGTSVTLTMTVTSNNACAPQTQTATYTIIVNPLPTATAGGTQTICSNATATVSGASATNGTILWTENGAGTITAGATTLTPTYTPTAADAGTSVTLTMTVTSNNACASQTQTATYTVIVNPLPTATAGVTQTICSNATATVSGASATNGTILWTENGAGTITAGATTLTPTYTPTAADAGTSVTLTMTVTSNNACAPQTQSATYTVLVNPLPTATAGGTQTICSNATATVSGASATNGTISWTENGAGTITAGATTLTPTYTPTAADAGTSVTLTMTVTSNNACAPQTQTAIYTVIVNPLPTATAGGTQTVCSNATATVSGASATNGTIAWTENGAGTITAGATTLTPTYTPTAADAGTSVTLTMTVTSNNTCAPQTQTATYTVIVNPLPTVSIAVNPGNNICAGTSVTFTATPINGGATPSYQWKVNGINVGTNIPTFTSASLMNTDKVTVVLTSSTACTSPVTSNLITMTVNDVVVPSVSISASATTICPGNSVIFSALATNGGITSSYQWMINGINTGTNSPNFSTSLLANGDIVTVRLTSNAICVSPITDISNSISITVNPATPATPGVISGISTVCPGITGLTYSIVAVTNATTYNWTIPTGWSITAGAGTNSITVTSGIAGQNGNISVTAGNSCGTSASASLPVTVSPATPATPGLITGIVTQCPALTGQTYSITAVTNATTYNWIVPTGWSITTGAGTNSITVTSGTSGQNGMISVTAENSCGTSSARTLAVTVNPATPATPGAITGTATQCPALSGQTYSIAAVANASSYTWTVPTGWTITGGVGTNSITVTSGSTGQNGSISVTATNSCGTSSASPLGVTVSPAAPATPGLIGGTPTVCPAIIGLTYSITTVPNATTYNWTVPTGWSITAGAGTNSITVTSGTSGQNGSISVTAENSCGISSARTLALTVSPATPATPGLILGTVTQCPALTGQTYSVSPVANATAYNWTVPTGWTITAGAGTNSITATSGTAGQNGTISVTASNSCGTSTASTLAVTVSPATPVTPGLITGIQTVCPAITGLAYSITLVPNATTYNWSVPTGWSITAGAGTNSITVTSGSTGQNGTISVTATNSCGTSSVRTLAVTVSPATPAIPGVISGSAEQCISRTGLVYSISAVANATSYTWTLPSGWSITTGTNTSSITVSTSGTAVAGNITVTANNSCGTSGAQTFAVSVNTAIPATPGLINGVTVICPTKTLTYSIAAVSNANSYVWTVPTNWSITSGQGTTSIIVQVPNNASSGFVSVVATNVCGNSSPSTLQVDVNTNGGVSAGIDRIVCSGTASIDLAGSISGVINNQNEWDWVVTTGTINSPNSLLSIYTLPPGFTSGNITIRIVSNQTTVDCPVVSDEMIITVLPLPTANISVTGANPICNGSTSNITFTATPNTTLTYTVSGIGGSSTINIGASGTATLTTAALTSSTTYTLTNVSYTSATTCSQIVSGTAIVTVNTAPTVNAGGPNVVCQSPTPSPITLSGATIGGGATTGAWSVTSGGGTLSNTTQTASPANVTYTPAANFSGTVTLTLTTNAPTACSPVSATRTITINAAPTVNAGGSDIVCQSPTPSAITLTGATVGGGATTGAWSITSGGGTLSNTLQTTSPATVTYTPAANFSGTVTLTLTTNAPTACLPVSTTRTFTINAAPTVNAGGSDIVCQSATPSAITLTGATIGGGATTGAWSITSGGGALSSTLQTATPATVTYTPAANFSGTVILTLTTNTPTACSPISATRTITVNANPTVNAGGPNTVCQSGTPSAITLTGATVSGGATTGAWSITSGGGTLSNTAQTASPATITYTPAANFSGIVTLTLTTNAPTACFPVSTTRTITINAAPTVNAGGSVTVCQSPTPSAITLTGATVGGGATTGAWSITSGGGTLSNTAQTASPETVTYTPAANFSGTVTLTLTTNALSGCLVTSAVKTITVNAAPTVNAGGPNTVCQSPTPPAITLSGATVGGGATTGAWSITSGGGLLSSTAQTATPATVTYTPTANFSGTVTLTLTTNALTACSTVSATRTITVDTASTVSAGTNQTICSNTTATMAGSFGGGASSAIWSTSGSGTFNNNTPTAIYSPSATDINSGTVTLTYTTNDPIGPCGAVSASIILTIKKVVVITNQPSNTSICASFPASLSVVAVGDGLTYQWYKGTAPVGIALVNSTNIIGAQSANLNFNQASLSDDGSYYVVISGASPCATVTSAQRTLNVDQAIIVSSQPVSQSLCNGSNVTFTVVADANGDPLSYQWRKNGSNIIGQTTSTLTINSITSGDDANYDVVISGPVGYTCSSVQSAIATLMVTQIPTVAISYVGNPFCKSTTTAQPVTRTGTNAFTGGTYSYSILTGGPTLSLDTSTGAITPSTSSAGTYTVTYTTPVTGICAPVTATTTVTITSIPTATISYTGAPFCNSLSSAQAVNLSGTNAYTGGIFSAPSGLTINTTTGAITPSTSTAGTYTITYTGPTAGGCSPASATTSITITPIPTATISYTGAPFCNSLSSARAVNLSGTNAYTGGTYSAPSGLTINTTTGAITPSTSTAGTYTVTYTGPTTGGCAPVSTTTSVTITPIPTATISYAGTPFCNSVTSAQAVNLSGTNAYTGGTYSAPSGLTINSTTGAITPSTSTAGTYTVSYTIPASGGCAISAVTTSVTINPLPVATFTYGSITFCKSAANPLLVFTGGGVAGVFSSTPAGLSINSSTGAINLATSTAGTYTVINTIAASGGCIAVTHSQSLTIYPVTIGGSITGYFSTTPTMISNLITACHLGSGTLTLSGFVGNILRWEYTTNGGVTWVPITNISATNNFTNISQTTLYRAVIESGACGLAYSAIAYVNVIPPNIKPDPVSASPSTLCLGSSSLFTSQSSYGTGQFLQGGDFQTGQLNTQDPRGWLVDGSPGGYTASANNTSSNHWAGTNPHPFPGGIIYDSGDPKFAIANGPLTSTLQTPIFNSLGLTTFSFGFDQAYKLLTGDRILIELSLNGGASYTVTLQDITGPAQLALFNTFANDNTSFDLQNYIGQTQLRVKFTFIGANTNSAWALDNFKFPDAPPNQTIEWTDEDGNIISTTNTASITPVSPGVQVYGVTTLINGCRSSGIDGTEFVTVNVNFAYAGKDLAIVPADCGNNTVTLNAYDNRLTAAQNIAKGAWDNNYITDTAIGTGATGKWTIKSSTAISPCNTATFLPNDTDPNATFTGDAGTYVLTWTAAGCSDDVSVVLRDCATINFDGANDNITFKDNYDFTAPFSIEVWVKPNAVTGTQTIFSKRDSNNLSTGYDLKLTGDKISFNWNGAGTIISNNAISTNRWYHIAVTFSGTTYRLYIDGIEVKNASGTLPTTNDFDCILGAMNRLGSQPVSYFNGWMDEVKIWNKALTPEQLHQIMNQEIKSNGTAVTGVIIPVDVNGLSWTTDLLGYYQMSSISCGYLNPTKGTAVGKLRNITSAQEQTAPIPYTSRVNGQDWSTDNTWTYFNVWDAPNSLGVDNSTPIDWNIVQISHNINSGNKDITILGLLSTAGKLTIADPVVTTPIENNDGQGLWVTLYLLLNGNIDLVGESQLVQKRYTATQYDESILDETSTGYIERDQQGKKNSFNYNYWSSPVSIQGNLNNSPFAISNVLKDGTNSLIPSTIDFNDGAFYADVVSNPIKISNRWLWSYNSQTLNSNTALDDYYQWKYVGSTGLIKTGEGYTMKGTGGSAPITALQNYVFIGKPNSGTITLTIPYNQTYLVGNPYPSAIDANSFIRDNLKDCSGCTNTVNVFNGALYFWDHFGLSNNHDLAEYEGGYATYTLMGGVAGIADSPLTATGAGTKVPQRYIPVGQGFFVDAYQDSQLTGPEIPASVTGGTLFFKNSQRVFVKESLANSLFMKTSGTTKSNAKDTDAETETRSKIRLGFDSSLGVHRQLLLGADSSTTSMFDIGYDAPMFDLSIDDMFWEINNIEYVIQAVTDFNENQIIPLGLTVGTEGKVKIKIDALENISNTTEIYLHDNVTGIYHDIRNSDFTISLAVGEYRNRFSLRFTNKTLDVDENNLNDGLIVLYSNNYKVLIIQNKALDSIVDEVRLFNILGQAVANWDVKNENQTKIQIPIKNLSSGVYIVKLKTSKGAYSKKIIIK
ncbi:LamG-like jellyroll fold domain-containing protein [Flavobacterium sp. LB3R33]|uniref:LamG-like jellyroll fold domain-containing protein n=1 Tax=Flavobacterium sp. LB3R33 TaxID=3401721 RepID=UPI003AAFE7B7